MMTISQGRGKAHRFTRSMKAIIVAIAAAVALLATRSGARDAGDPIHMMWIEGDVAGLSTIRSPDGKTIIGSVDYHQRRRGQVLSAVRIARFRDGSSDEDRVEARVGTMLQTLRGRSIIRNTAGVAIVDMTVDVEHGHITGFSGVGDERNEYDEHVDLTPGTYWGPFIFMLIKNFDRNAMDGKLTFRTVVATPKPRVLDMELLRKGKTEVQRVGERIEGLRFLLRPTVNPLIDPLIQMIVPETTFIVEPGSPPAMARFEGPRNYQRQKIRIE